VRIINKSNATERASRYISYSLFQHGKNAVARSDCATKNLVKKKSFKPSLQNGSAPNFHSRCICVTLRSVASARGCAFPEFDESLHDA